MAEKVPICLGWLYYGESFADRARFLESCSIAELALEQAIRPGLWAWENHALLLSADQPPSDTHKLS